MSGFAEYAFNKIREYNSFRKGRSQVNPNPFSQGQRNDRAREKGMQCIYRINGDDNIKGTCWNAPRQGRSPGWHAEERFFGELEDALAGGQVPSSVELIISASPCFGQCWQIIKGYAERLPNTTFAVLYPSEYSPDKREAAEPPIQFGEISTTRLSLLEAEESRIKNVWASRIKTTTPQDIDRALTHVAQELRTKPNYQLVSHPHRIAP